MRPILWLCANSRLSLWTFWYLFMTFKYLSTDFPFFQITNVLLKTMLYDTLYYRSLLKPINRAFKNVLCGVKSLMLCGVKSFTGSFYYVLKINCLHFFVKIICGVESLMLCGVEYLLMWCWILNMWCPILILWCWILNLSNNPRKH